MKKLLILLLSLCLVFGLTSCGGSTANKNFDVNVCFASEPQTIDPALNSSVDGAIMLQHSFEGLMKWVDDGKGNAVIGKGQASDYTVSADGLVYTFTIRSDAKWSDGQPVVAGDFKYAWDRLVDPKTAADYSYLISDLNAKWAAPDDKTFVVTLPNPVPYFLEICAFPAAYPVREDIIKSAGDQWTFDPATYIGNGPYKMSKWEHNSKITYVKNDQYYDFKNLGPASINFYLMDDANAMLAAFNDGTLNFNEGFPPEEVDSLLSSGQLKVAKYLGTYYVCFNTKDPIFKNPDIRKAFSLVIDRNFVVDQITKTGEKPANAYVPPGISDVAGPSGDDFRTVGGGYYSTAAADYDANVKEAQALLTKAGYPGGKGFPTVDYVYNTDARHKAIAEALQNMWQEKLGVKVNISNEEWGTFLETRKNGDFQIARDGWISDFNDPISFIDMWHTGGGNNDAQYSNPTYDKLVDAVKASTDNADRMTKMHQAEDIIMKANIIAPVYFYVQPYMVQGIENWYYTPLGYFFFGYATQTSK
jgi:oligopeptide transport system substrate-binding protein